MDRAFVKDFLAHTRFPPSAAAFVQALTDALSDDLEVLVSHFCESYDYRALTPEITALAARSGYSIHSLWLAVLILASKTAIPRYRSEHDFWQTFADLRCKAQECRDLHGVWGVFVPVWYPRFFRGEIVQLGRLQYDLQPWYGAEPLCCGDVIIRPQDPVLFLHIPSNGQPFDRESRLSSYRRAAAYFGQRPLVCLCDSWLLYPPYEAVFAPTSNIADFRREFHVCKVNRMEKFTLWNIVGPTYTQPPENWPQDTSLQRAFRQYAQNGGSFGTAVGVMGFDGERVITAHPLEKS